MGSKTKAEEDITHECEEHGNPPKKRKTDSLMLEVENRNFTKLKELVSQGVDVKIPGNFLLREQQRFEDVPALFAAILSDQYAIVDFLVGNYPHFLVQKKEKAEDPDCLVLPTNIDTEKLIEVLELVGAACIFHGDAGARKHGWTCWNEAMKLRNDNAIPKTALPPSKWEKLALRNKLEFQTAEELKQMPKQRRTHWKTQAFIISQRILKKYDCFPNGFVVYNLFKFALPIWGDRRSNRSRSFAISLYLIELFRTATFLDQIVLNPTCPKNVVHLTFTELLKILKNQSWVHDDLNKPDTILTFDNFMIILVFSCEYLAKVNDHGPNDAQEEEISDLIFLILKLLLSIPKSKIQSSELKFQLQTFHIYENMRTNQKPNLLLKVCAAHKGETNDFKLVKLLLKTGANPNAVDQQRCSPLHLLAKKERDSIHMWRFASYSTRAQYFNSTVRAILDGRFHEDQVNLEGKSALECLKCLVPYYPNAQFCQLLSNFLEGLRPLSCIAAKVARTHRLPCGRLPMALQSFVLQH